MSRWSELPDDLVLLREVPEGEIVRLERSLSAGLSAHRSAVDPLLQEATAHAWRRSASPQVLRREHEMFEVSMRELGGLITLVREDGHGGNRQALGQYLRLLWEALRRHVRDEEALLETPPDGSRA
ncbi:MAG TPA: hypothetical protein VGS23_00880 [Thermoplasmata archaeon]|nr:hypothetical protein [Thermoplasmata archaeon]